MTNWQLVLRKVPSEREPRASFRERFQPEMERASFGLEPSEPQPRELHVVPLRTEQAVSMEAQEIPGVAQTPLRSLVAAGAAALRWLNGKKPAARRMRLTETVSLGEKRFVSILQVDGKQILIGSSAGNVSMLAILDGKQDGITAARTALEQVAC